MTRPFMRIVTLAVLCALLPLSARANILPSGIDAAELVEIALDGRDPADIIEIAIQALLNDARFLPDMQAVPEEITVQYLEEFLEPVLEVLFRRAGGNTAMLRVGLSVGLFELMYIGE